MEDLGWVTTVTYTKDDEASPTMMRFGYEKSMLSTRTGFIRCKMWAVCSLRGRSLSSSMFLTGIVSGRRTMTRMDASPPIPVCIQKISRQEAYVTITPPRSGARHGPIRAPERNQDKAVPRAVGV